MDFVEICCEGVVDGEDASSSVAGELAEDACGVSSGSSIGGSRARQSASRRGRYGDVVPSEGLLCAGGEGADVVLEAGLGVGALPAELELLDLGARGVAEVADAVVLDVAVDVELELREEEHAARAVEHVDLLGDELAEHLRLVEERPEAPLGLLLPREEPRVVKGDVVAPERPHEVPLVVPDGLGEERAARVVDGVRSSAPG